MSTIVLLASLDVHNNIIPMSKYVNAMCKQYSPYEYHEMVYVVNCVPVIISHPHDRT